MQASKRILLLILATFTLLFVILLVTNVFSTFSINKPQTPAILEPTKYTQKVLVGDAVIFVEIADTTEKITKGLSGRKSLGKNQGMLFIMPKNSYPTFWMKGMFFPIDIIWIDERKIIGIEENVQPEPGKKDYDLSLYHPPEPIDFVLEVNAGFVKEKGIKVGDSVNLGQI